MTQTRKPLNTASAVVRALEDAWSAIQQRHPEVPSVYVTVGMGSTAAGLKLGHFGSFRWHTDDDDPGAHELFIGGEGLRRGPSEVLNTLLHEAVHALATARDIKDTSRQGRYHNGEFMKLAKELGLEPTGADNGDCTVPDATEIEYMDVLTHLSTELDRWRESEFGIDWDQLTAEGSGDTVKIVRKPPSTEPRTKSVVSCDCDRRIKIAKAVLEAGPITCGICGTPFTRKMITE